MSTDSQYAAIAPSQPSSPKPGQDAKADTAKAQQDLKADIEQVKNITLNIPTGRLGAELNAINEQLYSAIPTAFPHARLPPKPEAYIFDSPLLYALYGQYRDKATGADVSAIGDSSTALRKLTAEEIAAANAHETGHILVRENPDMVPNYTPPAPKAVNKELSKLDANGAKLEVLAVKTGADPETAKAVTDELVNEAKANYREELVADKVSVALTHDPKALESALAKGASENKSHNNTVLQQVVKSSIQDEAKERGGPLTAQEKSDQKKMVKLAASLMDRHPSLKVRKKEIELEAKQLHIDPGGLKERMEEKLKSLGLSPASPLPSVPDSAVAPQDTPAVARSTGQQTER